MNRTRAAWSVVLIAVLLPACDLDFVAFDRSSTPPPVPMGTPVARPSRPRHVVPIANLVDEPRDEYNNPLLTPDALEAVSLVRSRQGPRVTMLLRSVQTRFEEDGRREDWLLDAYEGFDTADATLTAPLDEWCAAEPTSDVAWAARGIHGLALGAAARGTKFAPETAAERFTSMGNEFASAEPALRRALSLRPRLIVAHIALMDLTRFVSGKEEVLSAMYDLAIKAAPSSFQVRRTYLVSLLPRWGGSYQRVSNAVQALRPLVPGNPRLRALEGLVPWDEGRRMKDDLASLAKFDEALSHGNDAAFYEDRARALRNLKRYAEALTDYEAAAALRPNRAEIYYGQAHALYSLNRDEQLLVALDRASALDPGDSWHRDWRLRRGQDLVYRGHKAYVAGSNDESLRLLGLAARFDPGSAKAAYWMGQVLVKAGQLDQAIAPLERAIALDPQDFSAHVTLDYILARRGEWDKVIAGWDAFLRVEPKHAQAWLERAGAKRHGGDLRGARSDLNTACDLGSQEACAHLRRPL